MPLECSSRAHAMCAIRDTVWVGTEEHGLFVFSVPKRKLLQRWPIVGGDNDDFNAIMAKGSQPILAILHDEVHKCVLVLGYDETLAVFEDEVGYEADIMSSFSPVSHCALRLRLITQYNTADTIGLVHCMTIVNQSDVWVGLDRGQIAILDAQSLRSHGNQIITKKRLNTSNRPKETGLGEFVKCLVTGQCTDEDNDDDEEDDNESTKYVWCGLHWSQVVYQWDAATQQEAGHIDCYSVLKKKGVSDRDSRVTSMLVHAGHLFIGTGGGHVVVVAIPCMQILTTMLPHSGAVRCLIPFQPALCQQMSFLLSSEQTIKQIEMLNDPESWSPNGTTAVPNCALRQIRRAAVLSCGLGLYGLTKQDSAHYPPDILPVDEDEGHMLMWLADNWTTPSV